MSFLEFLRDRYEKSCSLSSSVQVLVNLIQISKPLSLHELELVSLKRTCIEHAGDPTEISSVCPNVRQLDLSWTKITSWTEIIKILSELKVSFT